ncbi:MAG: hypothetical protein M1812_003681 [Candelaria pacifica]|nr:MAG: hypothetical protein M1812_003681 [Candelaria pacifica]
MDIFVECPSPEPGTEEASFPPKTLLRCPFHIASLTDTLHCSSSLLDTTNLRLHPPVSTADRSILHYMRRNKLCYVPTVVSRYSEALEAQAIVLEERKQELDDMRTSIERMLKMNVKKFQGSVTKIREEFVDTGEALMEFKQKNNERDYRRLRFFEANLRDDILMKIYDLLKKCKKGKQKEGDQRAEPPINDRSRTVVETTARDVDLNQIKNMNNYQKGNRGGARGSVASVEPAKPEFPEQQLDWLKDSKINEERNQYAHETHVQFAKFLKKRNDLNDPVWSGRYHKFDPLLYFLLEQRIEQLASTI